MFYVILRIFELMAVIDFDFSAELQITRCFLHKCTREGL